MTSVWRISRHSSATQQEKLVAGICYRVEPSESIAELPEMAAAMNFTMAMTPLAIRARYMSVFDSVAMSEGG